MDDDAKSPSVFDAVGPIDLAHHRRLSNQYNMRHHRSHRILG